MQSAKHDTMRSVNTATILECIRDYGPLTKREIQEKTGLSWGAVSNITTSLLNKKIVVESKSTDSSVGRIPSELDINGDANLIVGVDINIEGITAVIIDLKFRVLRRMNTELLKNNRDEIIKQAKQMIYTIMKESGVDSQKIIGIGVAMQGTIDVTKGISVFSPHFLDWNNVPVKDILEQEFNIPVFMEHDPNCMALAERWLGVAKKANNLLFIRLSMGIGMSIIINGEVYRGADGSAGEFGHITMDMDGPRCSCGNYGCLELYASGSSILRKAREGVKLGRAEIAASLLRSKSTMDLELVIEAARQGDSYMKSLFDDAGVYLGVGISNLINIFNPDLIVIGGKLSNCEDLFMSRTNEIISQKVWKGSRINMVSSKLDTASAAIGAAAVIAQDFFASGFMMEI